VALYKCLIIIRAVPNTCFAFASGPNNGSNNYSVFERIVISSSRTEYE